jgi:hypothetical protein
MIYAVSVTNSGSRDLERCYAFIEQRSTKGAVAWVNAFQKHILDALAIDPYSYEMAPESRSHPVEIRQKLLRTRQGRNYRAIFMVREN